MAKSKDSASRAEQLAAARKVAQAQVRAEQRRVTVMWIAAAVIVVGVFAALVAFIVRQNSVGEVGVGEQLEPASVTSTDGFPVGQSGVVGADLDPERVQVEIYADFMCPVCAVFEEINAGDLDAMRAEGLIDVTYHPIAILDSVSRGTAYSTRSASAAALVAEESPENFVKFVDLLFVNQPAEYTAGLNDGQLKNLAIEAGVPEEVAAKIGAYSYSQWVAGATERSSIAGITGTPTVFIDGVNQSQRVNPDGVNWTIPGAMRAAVIEAASK